MKKYIDWLGGETIQLNYRIGSPSINGNIYPKEVLCHALDRAIGVVGVLQNEPSRYEEDNVVIGKLISYVVDEHNFVNVNIRLNTNVSIQDGTYVTTSGQGSVVDNIVSNFTILNLYLTTDI